MSSNIDFILIIILFSICLFMCFLPFDPIDPKPTVPKNKNIDLWPGLDRDPGVKVVSFSEILKWWQTNYRKKLETWKSEIEKYNADAIESRPPVLLKKPGFNDMVRVGEQNVKVSSIRGVNLVNKGNFCGEKPTLNNSTCNIKGMYWREQNGYSDNYFFKSSYRGIGKIVIHVDSGEPFIYWCHPVHTVKYYKILLDLWGQAKAGVDTVWIE